MALSRNHGFELSEKFESIGLAFLGVKLKSMKVASCDSAGKFQWINFGPSRCDLGIQSYRIVGVNVIKEIEHNCDTCKWQFGVPENFINPCGTCRSTLNKGEFYSNWNSALVKKPTESEEPNNPPTGGTSAQPQLAFINAKYDPVEKPMHYNKGKYEVIDIIESVVESMDLTPTEAVLTSQVLKYVSRWKNKNLVQDLKKAQWYLTRLIKNMEEK
jgi:hypothetical protein